MTHAADRALSSGQSVRARENVAFVSTPTTRLRDLGPVTLTLLAALVGCVVTLLVILLPGLHFAYRSVRGHVALETFDACAAAAVTLLFFGRCRRSASVSDLRMTVAFFLMTLTGVFLVVIAVGDTPVSPMATVWFPLVTRLISATLVALAASEGSRRVRRDVPVSRILIGLSALFAALAVAAVATSLDLPTPIDVSINPTLSGRPMFVGNPVVEMAQIAHALLYSWAALAFTRRAAVTPDGMLRWLGAGCALGAAARLNYFLFPSIYSQWLYTGDFLRTGFYLALVVGGIREVAGYWHAQAEAAVFSERRRLARELHDGAVQELGYIRTLARGLAQSPGTDAGVERIAAAAERALAEARHAIEALSMPLDQPLAELVRRAATEIADRYDVAVSVDAQAQVPVDAAGREALVRIVREAVSNAARHGRASTVRITIRDGCMEIRDNGLGFDPEDGGAGGSADSGGFGLVSMRDRAEAMRAMIDVSSAPGDGTTVKVVWRAKH